MCALELCCQDDAGKTKPSGTKVSICHCTAIRNLCVDIAQRARLKIDVEDIITMFALSSRSYKCVTTLLSGTRRPSPTKALVLEDTACLGKGPPSSQRPGPQSLRVSNFHRCGQITAGRSLEANCNYSVSFVAIYRCRKRASRRQAIYREKNQHVSKQALKRTASFQNVWLRYIDETETRASTGPNCDCVVLIHFDSMFPTDVTVTLTLSDSVTLSLSLTLSPSPCHCLDFSSSAPPPPSLHPPSLLPSLSRSLAPFRTRLLGFINLASWSWTGMETWRRDMSAVSRLKSANTTVCCNHFNHCNRPQYDTGFRMDFLFSPLRTPCTFFERAASTPSTAEHWPITRHGCNALCCYFCCNALCCYFCSRRQAVQGVLLR